VVTLTTDRLSLAAKIAARPRGTRPWARPEDCVPGPPTTPDATAGCSSACPWGQSTRRAKALLRPVGLAPWRRCIPGGSARPACRGCGNRTARGSRRLVLARPSGSSWAAQPSSPGPGRLCPLAAPGTPNREGGPGRLGTDRRETGPTTAGNPARRASVQAPGPEHQRARATPQSAISGW